MTGTIMIFVIDLYTPCLYISMQFTHIIPHSNNFVLILLLTHSKMPSWPSETDSDEQAYEQMRLQALEDEFEFLIQITPHDEPSHEQGNLQHLQQVQVPHVQLANEQTLAQPQQEVEFYRVPPHEHEGESYPVLCYCGHVVEVMVRAEGDNIGRRMQQCRFYPNGCSYTEWIDEPLCPRGIVYANQLEREIMRLENLVQELRLNAMRLP